MDLILPAEINGWNPEEHRLEINLNFDAAEQIQIQVVGAKTEESAMCGSDIFATACRVFLNDIVSTLFNINLCLRSRGAN